MKAFLVVLAFAGVAAFVLRDQTPDLPPGGHDTWTYIGHERGKDEIDRDVLVLMCEKRGRTERVPIRHGEDETYADVKFGDPCPGTLDPDGPHP